MDDQLTVLVEDIASRMFGDGFVGQQSAERLQQNVDADHNAAVDSRRRGKGQGERTGRRRYVRPDGHDALALKGSLVPRAAAWIEGRFGGAALPQESAVAVEEPPLRGGVVSRPPHNRSAGKSRCLRRR